MKEDDEVSEGKMVSNDIKDWILISIFWENIKFSQNFASDIFFWNLQHF